MPDGKLTVLKIKALTKIGRHSDGGGLYCQVSRTGTKTWIFRYMLRRQPHEMGLGSIANVSLAQARTMAQEARRLLAQGIDPIQARQAAQRQASAPAHTFQAVAEQYLSAHQSAWRNPKHRAQWHSTLATYAYPQIGTTSVAEITTADVLAVLQPIWNETPETASRLRGRIEAILSYAKSLNWRTGENPAQWRDNLDNLLPSKGKVARPDHHAALPWQDLPAFMADLAKRDGTSAAALQFLILTATRSGETLNATWAEIDATNKVWIIPPERMKAGREHRVPLSAPALAVLSSVKPDKPDPTAFIFAGSKPHQPLSDMALTMVLRRMKRSNITVHGFRSTFRDWASEATTHQHEVAEMALAHAVPNKVEAAYRRGDLFEKRRALMADWGKFCGGGQ